MQVRDALESIFNTHEIPRIHEVFNSSDGKGHYYALEVMAKLDRLEPLISAAIFQKMLENWSAEVVAEEFRSMRIINDKLKLRICNIFLFNMIQHYFDLGGTNQHALVAFMTCYMYVGNVFTDSESV
jgi:hypothetical protein